MHLDKFGDSYDVVKQSLFRWLSPCGRWAVDPMFTEEVGATQAEAFERFLKVPLLRTGRLSRRCNRAEYLGPAARCCDHVFLDPNTGLRIPEAADPEHLGGIELVEIATNRPGRLTLVFDQSYNRRQASREQLDAKLAWLEEKGVAGAAYQSHACFILASTSESALRDAVDILLTESRLPRRCVVTGPWGRRTSA